MTQWFFRLLLLNEFPDMREMVEEGSKIVLTYFVKLADYFMILEEYQEILKKLAEEVY